MTFRCSTLFLALLLAESLRAQDRRVTFGAFVDSYYAWDFGRPPSRDRSFAGGTPFTTQPARHNEFNINLAFLEASVASPDVRARVALQAGTSVQSNYASEPATGLTSGSSLSRHLQEGVVGVRIADSLWVDAGIFFSHVGMEGWISADNLTYTRSLVAEYSPYYQSGVKLAWMRGPWRVRLDVVNGWQNVSESNDGKAAGLRLDWTRGPTTVSYYNLISAEPLGRRRAFHGLGTRFERGKLSVLAEADLGSQTRSLADGSTAWWRGFTTAARLRVRERVAITGRIESFEDRDQVVLGTGSTASGPNPPCRCLGASLGVDVDRPGGAKWRTELRGFRARDALFPSAGAASKTNALLVTSLALRM